MGQAANAGLAELVRQYNLNAFVETGTGWGLSIRDALAIPQIVVIHSIEIDRGTYDRNVAQFAAETRVNLWHGDSRDTILAVVQTLEREARVCWYLDAHFPGSANGVQMLPLRLDALDAVPIRAEVKAIQAARGTAFQNDVVIIDDRCLWEADNYSAGDIADFREQLRSDDLGALEGVLSETHRLERTTVDMGYAIFHPSS